MNLTRRELLKWAALAAVAETAAESSQPSAQADEIPGGPSSDLVLWYREPASGWGKALTLGNGRLGAMVFGGTDLERVGLNEDSLWSGGPYDPAPTVDAGVLEQIRQLSFAGKLKDAQILANKLQGTPRTEAAYQTVGEIQLAFSGHQTVTAYRRELNLDTAIATVTYTLDGIDYKREVLASPVDQVVVIRLTASQPGKLTFDTTFVTPLPGAKIQAVASDSLTLDAR
jgi:alpha-L-fucosidase 2